MRLSEFSVIAGTHPKRVLNILPALGLKPDYSLDLAKLLAIALEVHHSAGLPLKRAVQLSRLAMRVWKGDRAAVTLISARGVVGLTIDVYRILAAVEMRRAQLGNEHDALARGRPVARVIDPLVEADEWGVDLSLLAHNLRQSHAQRLRQLDAMVAFAKNVNRSRTDVADPNV